MHGLARSVVAASGRAGAAAAAASRSAAAAARVSGGSSAAAAFVPARTVYLKKHEAESDVKNFTVVSCGEHGGFTREKAAPSFQNLFPTPLDVFWCWGW